MKFTAKCFLMLTVCTQSAVGQSNSGENAFALVPVYQQSKVFKVYASGKVDSFELGFDGGSVGVLGKGDTKARSSYDNSVLAFVSDNDIWFYEVFSDIARRITFVGAHEDEKFASVTALITDWSKDNQKLLYYVLPGQTYKEDYDGANLEERAVNYGFHIYDLKKDEHQQIEISGEYRDWINSKELLSALYDKGQTTLSRVHLNGRRSETITVLPGSIGQPRVSLDGRWLIAVHHAGRDQNRLIKIDLQSGRLVELTPDGRFAEYQWPSFSPGGHNIAYLKVEHLSRSDQVQSVMVNDEDLSDCRSQFIRYYWIADGHLAIWCKKEILVYALQEKNLKVRFKM